MKTRLNYLSAIALAFMSCGIAETSSAIAQHTSPPSQAEQNRALVLYFSEQVFNKHDMAVAERFLSDGYIQHNPNLPTGKAAFIKFFTEMATARPNLHSEIIRSAVDGNLVYTHVRTSDGTPGGTVAIVNIFRVENDKIVEHWDVVQAVPPTAANTNTMF